eukprot:TRINITY_DN23301_c0_g1_i1.p2 TRINITY_DN23301_c0_g1~~TRINITY_DN23301_c0_g1_i1.p2  ORF type:complete len:137 (-),score=7.46 TRINITY_DN23301_c0_g1_i1:371-781(-)
MCSEFMELGDLRSLLVTGSLSSADCMNASFCIARGMAYIESKALVHRDLAARNVLCRHDQDGSLLAKIGDLGMIHSMSTMTSDSAFNPLWAAPEVIVSGNFTSRSDVYAFGVTLWEVCTVLSILFAGRSTDSVFCF